MEKTNNSFPVGKLIYSFSTFILAVLTLLLAGPAHGESRRVLHTSIPDVVSALQPTGRLAGTNRLNLAISLPLRNTDKLGQLLQEISDPASPNFRQYLTPAQFTEQFGPTDADYQTLIAFAHAQGLNVSGTHSNRMLLDVNGAVADIERALHVKMQVYQHPTEARTFYAPDSAPSLDLATPVLDVSGLENYSRPQPLFVTKPLASGQTASPSSGSGIFGTYMGKDFRAAYVPDTTLTGAGQTVGLLQFDGYTPSDITYYENAAGLPNVTLSNVLLDGFSGEPTGDGGEVEVSLDIEMSISMAPGLLKVIVYMAGPEGNWHDILNRMANDNLAKQMSCSWYIPGGGPDPVAEQIFQQMGAQGQTFFAASGDSDAYTGLIPFPGDSTNITEVGGTTLTTFGPIGPWASETVWNWGGGTGSSGGSSTSYAIPSWQTNINMTANLGSTTKRNTPDVAMTADNVYVRADGRDDNVGGTSCASPLWAGFTALVNQQAIMSGRPTVGFINPALDTIGSGINYSVCFHDIATGNNTSPFSPTKFFAVSGYDLCTGWGAPAGQKLINALATPDPLGVLPDSGFTAIGGSGGPFTVASESFTVTNSGTNTLSWTLGNTAAWLNVSPAGGTLSAGGIDTTPLVSLSSNAYTLPIGTYTAIVAFTNTTSGVAQNRQFALEVVPSVPPTIQTGPVSQSAAVGSTVTFNVIPAGTPPLSYQWNVNTTNINGATNASLTLSNVNLTQTGNYTVTVTNTLGSTNATAILTVGTPPSITAQPVNVDVVQGSNATFSVTATGTGPLGYQWYYYGLSLAGTNSTLTVTNVQATNSGVYSVVVSSPFGFVTSSNAFLTVDVFPVIVTQPLSQGVDVGSNFSLSVTATGTAPVLPPVVSGTLQLWLRADAGVITNSAGLVSQWQDQSANTNHAFQTNVNLQPEWVAATGLGGKAAVRFNGIQNNVNGSYMFGPGLVNIPNALTAFSVYNAFSDTNAENLVWEFGVPGQTGDARGDLVTDQELRFTFWGIDYSMPFTVPTNTYRLRTDRLDTNIDTLNVFDATATSATNFTVSVGGAKAPGAGYYLGGYNAALPFVGTSRNFNGDIAELILYSGYLSEADRLAVSSYLEQKYFQATTAGGNLSYQWQFDGTNIASATNSSLTLIDAQTTNAGNYSVIVSNAIGLTVSSNATISVGYPPVITNQPQSEEVIQGTTVAFTVGVSSAIPVSYQWYFDGATLPQATNASLILTNIQATNSGSYYVTAGTPFGSVSSSNVTLTIDLLPVIIVQPQSQNALAGTNVTFSVAATATVPNLPSVSSGTLQLWLKADAGVITNSSGLVSQWQDQSANSNNAAQANTNLQPALVAATGLGGRAAVRFNGIQNNITGSYLNGVGQVAIPHAMTAFSVYNAFSAVNAENLVWSAGVPGQTGASRGDLVTLGDLRFTFWSIDYSMPFVVPTNTYRLRTDRLDTNIDTLNVFDATATTDTNFTVSVSGANSIGAGYYLGGYNASLPGVGTSRNFNGDIAELILYSGYLSEPDRLAVTAYLQQKYFESTAGNLSYQWQFDGTNIANATNSSLVLTDVQPTNDGNYTVIISNMTGSVVSSNAVLAVGYSPTITNQPQSQELAQDASATFTVGVGGTGPITYQWYFNGMALAQAISSALSVADIQSTNSGTYDVIVSSPFGSATSSNAKLKVDLLPIIVTQPQSQMVNEGSNVTFSATTTVSSPLLPATSSGTLQLWLKADAGVVTNSSGLVSQWQDQSANTNHAVQANVNLQPELVAATGLDGKAAVRFNGIQNNVNGSYMFGPGLVNIPNALTAFSVYNAFSATNAENLVWAFGVPGDFGYERGDLVTLGEPRFTFWGIDYSMPFTVPTNTYRLRTDRLDTNIDTLNVFDATATSATNFTVSVGGAQTPGAGYYLGGYNASLQDVGTSRNFNGDIAELILYSGYLSEADRLAVTSYLEQKYFQAASGETLAYQWQFDGTNIAGATNSSLTLPDVQTNNDGAYSVIIDNGVASTASSNAVLTVDVAPVIHSQPASLTINDCGSVTFAVSASGTPKPSYQWMANGFNIAGATGPTLTLTNLTPSEGGSYTVLVSNSVDFVTSTNAVLLVNYVMVTRQGQSQQLAITNLTLPTVTLPGDTFTVSSVDSVSRQGGSIQLTNGVINYTPANSFTGADLFDYVLTAAYGPTITGSVTVLVDSSSILGGKINGGLLTIQFAGLPGITYTIQASTDLINWTTIGAVTAGPNGKFQFQDFSAGFYQQRYYRTLLQ